MKVKLINVLPDNCTGCRLCEMMCSLRREQECSTSKSRIKILTGKEWSFDFPFVCIQCANAPCIGSCPVEALQWDNTTGVVVVNAELCNGCQLCLTACPIQALVFDHEKGIVIKCDLCGGDPECVKCCTREALILEEADVNSPSRKAYMEKASKLLDMR